MMVLYAGFPAAIEAFRLWRERGGGGEGPLRRIRSARTGGATFVAIYGSRAGRVRKVMRALSPELEALMMDVGYGRVLSRPGLDLASRELVTVAALVAGTWPRQLRSHLEGAERAGVPRRELRARLQKWLNTMSSGDQGRILAELGMWDPGFPQRGGSQ